MHHAIILITMRWVDAVPQPTENKNIQRSKAWVMKFQDALNLVVANYQ